MPPDPYAPEVPKPFLIAEIGINHNGSVRFVKQLVDQACEAGWQAVKFQKRTVDVVYAPEQLDSARESPWGATFREQKEGLELDREAYDEIDRYCRDKGISWFASAWDEASQEFLRGYDPPYNKIASAMLTHRRLVEMVAEEGRHTFISTGMSDWPAIDRVVDLFVKRGCPFTLLHCVSVYPCPDEWCNVRMVQVLRERYRCPVGYSGHELGLLPSVLAVALGAQAIERHITLDRSMYGSDQSASLERRGMELLARDCRELGPMLGSGEKLVIPDEEKVAYKLRYFRNTPDDWE